MSRRVRAILACILAGIVATLITAWTLAWIRPLRHPWPGMFAIDSRKDCWMGFGEHGPGWTHLTLYGAAGITDAADVPSLPRWIDTPRAGDIESRCVSVIGGGWPMIAFRAKSIGLGHADPPPGRGWHSGLGPQWVEWGHWQGAVASASSLPTNPSIERVLPMGVAWLGLAINTLFWSALCALPMLFLAGRRSLRRHRGRCPACGYDLLGHLAAGCTECGWRRAQAVQTDSAGVLSKG
jgi:hypothetical protein